MAFMNNTKDLRESQVLEFKDAFFALPDDIWETYSAFANTEGGEIVLGVSQNPETKELKITGVQDPDSLITDFWSKIRNPDLVSKDVLLFDSVNSESVSGVSVIIINVPKAQRCEKPVGIYDKKKRAFRYYIRRGEGDFPASEAELKLMSYDSAELADRGSLNDFELNSLRKETLIRYRKIFATVKPQSPWILDSDIDFLYHIGAVSKGRDGTLHPTQAGLLAFGEEHEITRFSPHFFLDYREETSGHLRWDDRATSQDGSQSGNLIDFYLLVAEKLKKTFKNPFSTDEFGLSHGSRNPVTEAVNEAVVNALVHSWYGSDANVKVIVTSDSIEVSNPGSLLIDKGVAIAGGTSETRNPTLMRIFSLIGASDRAGSGLFTIWNTWKDNFQGEPKLVEAHNPARVILTLPLIQERSRKNPILSNKTLKKQPTDNTAILEALSSQEEGITAALLAEMLGLSERRTQEKLKELHEAQKINREKKGRYYVYFSRR